MHQKPYSIEKGGASFQRRSKARQELRILRRAPNSVINNSHQHCKKNNPADNRNERADNISYPILPSRGHANETANLITVPYTAERKNHNGNGKMENFATSEEIGDDQTCQRHQNRHRPANFRSHTAHPRPILV